MLNFMPVILKNLFSKSTTRLYPLEKKEPFEKVRGELDINILECKLCGICERKCPAACIKVDKEEKTWTLDPFLCVYCGVCVDNCPTNCLFFNKQYRQPEVKKFIKTAKKINNN